MMHYLAIKRGVCNIASPFHAVCIPVWVVRNDRSCAWNEVERAYAKFATASRKLHVADKVMKPIIKNIFFVHFTDLSRAMFTTRDGFGMPARFKSTYACKCTKMQCNAAYRACSIHFERNSVSRSKRIYLFNDSEYTQKIGGFLRIKMNVSPLIVHDKFSFGPRGTESLKIYRVAFVIPRFCLRCARCRFIGRLSTHCFNLVFNNKHV